MAFVAIRSIELRYQDSVFDLSYTSKENVDKPGERIDLCPTEFHETDVDPLGLVLAFCEGPSKPRGKHNNYELYIYLCEKEK